MTALDCPQAAVKSLRYTWYPLSFLSTTVQCYLGCYSVLSPTKSFLMVFMNFFYAQNFMQLFLFGWKLLSVFYLQILHWSDHKEECKRLEQQMKCVDILNDFPFTFSQEASLQVIISGLILCSSDYIDFPNLFVKSARPLKRRLGVYSWAKGASIKWECGCMNALVEHQLLLLIALGYLPCFVLIYLNGT